MPYLLFQRGTLPQFRVFLRSSSLKIGRSDQCDVVLEESEISREHAAIYSIERQNILKRLGKGKVTVNGEEIESRSLKDGDQIEIGGWRAQFIQKTEIHGDLKEETVFDSLPTQNHTQAVAHISQNLLCKEWLLKIHEAGRSLRTLPLKNSVFSVGADPNNDLVLHDPFISARHFKLVARDGALEIVDLGSTNGTYVNGIKVREAEIEEGAVLKIGQSEIHLLSEDKIEKPKPIQESQFMGMVGSSLEMRQLFGLLQKVSPTQATVLVLGESGTGKELVAQAIHSLSPRSKKPFVAINCGAISPELIESELFGHEKGAFTGAIRQHDGAFGQAAGGALFLDEIGELPLSLQPKLLRVLENQTYRRVGGVEELRADVRIIAATHQNLAKLVQERKFREDLFFRLFVLPISIPALRQRTEDIPRLCEHFLKEFSITERSKSLTDEALNKLVEYPFYGNVRELKNVLLRAVVLSRKDQIKPEEIVFAYDATQQPAENVGTSLETLEAMEKKLVLKALAANKWNKARTAEVLGVAKSTLFAKIKLYDLKEPTE